MKRADLQQGVEYAVVRWGRYSPRGVVEKAVVLSPEPIEIIKSSGYLLNRPLSTVADWDGEPVALPYFARSASGTGKSVLVRYADNVESAVIALSKIACTWEQHEKNKAAAQAEEEEARTAWQDHAAAMRARITELQALGAQIGIANLTTSQQGDALHVTLTETQFKDLAGRAIGSVQQSTSLPNRDVDLLARIVWDTPAIMAHIRAGDFIPAIRELRETGRRVHGEVYGLTAARDAVRLVAGELQEALS